MTATTTKAKTFHPIVHAAKRQAHHAKALVMSAEDACDKLMSAMPENPLTYEQAMGYGKTIWGSEELASMIIDQGIEAGVILPKQ